MALQENQIDVGSMINVDYVGPNYKTPDSNSWKDYTNPLECLTQLTTLGGSYGLPLIRLYVRMSDYKRYVTNDNAAPSTAYTLNVDQLVMKLDVDQAALDVKYLLLGSADYGAQYIDDLDSYKKDGANRKLRYGLQLGAGDYRSVLKPTGTYEKSSWIDIWLQFIASNLQSNDDPLFKNLVGIRIPYYDRGVSKDENGNAMVPVITGTNDPNYIATVQGTSKPFHQNLINKKYVRFLELVLVGTERRWADFVAVYEEGGNDVTINPNFVTYAGGSGSTGIDLSYDTSLIKTVIKPKMADSCWCYVKTINGSGKLPSQESKLREYIDKWYQLRDEHAQSHPANANTGFRDIEACATYANEVLTPGNPAFWDIDSVKIGETAGNAGFTGVFENKVGNYHPEIRYWDTQYSFSFANLFKNSTFNNPLPWDRITPDVPEFATRLTSMKDMFRGNKYFNNGQAILDINGDLISPIPTPKFPLLWNRTKNVKDFSGMFAGTDTTVTYFNQDISTFTIEGSAVNPVNLSEMFYKNVNFNQSLTSKSLTTLNQIKMPDNQSVVDSTYPGKGYVADKTKLFVYYTKTRWDVSDVNNMSKMFQNATSYDNGVQITGGPTMMNTANQEKEGNDIALWDVGNVTNFAFMFNNATKFDRRIKKWNVSCSLNTSSNPNPLEKWLENSGLSNVDQYNQGFKGISEATCANFNTNYPCFREGTKILCFKDGKEQEIPVEELRQGDKIVTYKQGYQPIADMRRGETVLGRLNDMGMFKLKKQGSMTNDLEMTGLHALLVDENYEHFDEEMKKQQEVFKVANKESALEDKYRLRATFCSKFEKMPIDEYTIYSFSLGGAQVQYGIYANGALVETTSQRILDLSSIEKVGVKYLV